MNNLEKEINSLKKELLNMFLLVESQWKKSTIAILEFDQDIAEEISSIELPTGSPLCLDYQNGELIEHYYLD